MTNDNEIRGVDQVKSSLRTMATMLRDRGPAEFFKAKARAQRSGDKLAQLVNGDIEPSPDPVEAPSGT